MLLRGRKRAICLHKTFTVDKIRQGSLQMREREKHSYKVKITILKAES